MNKFKNKKGFSLIEMLIVIAIVAALVSIIVPTVQEATLKSRAATNAANLRSVEGLLTTMRVENYDAFFTASERIEANLTGGLTQVIKDRLDFWFPGLSTEVSNALRTIKAENGEFTLDFSNGLQKVPAPASEEIHAPGGTYELNLDKDVQMEIFVTDNKVVCMYNGYTKEDFADVAEDGKYDGTGGTSTGGGTGLGGFIGDIAEGLDQYAKCNVPNCNNYRVPLSYFCSDHRGWTQCPIETCKTWYDGDLGVCPNAATKHAMCKFCNTAPATTADGYCASHTLKNCQKKVLGTNWLGQKTLVSCSGQYRDSNVGKCTENTHYKTQKCGCMEGKNGGFLGLGAGTCANASCGHEHRVGTTCTETVYVVDNG